MKSFRSVGLLALALAACAPARTASPIPDMAPVLAGSGTRAGDGRPASPVTPPSVSLAAAPDQWWLKDPVVDGIPGMGVERAYRELLAGRQPRRTVVVAIIDSGLDTEHEDLRANVWVNPGEVPGNGRDDDGNGYVDDVHGWNFLGGPDGRNVQHDTYEMTRLFVRLQPRYEKARADTLRGEALAEYEIFVRVKADFEAEREEVAQTLRQIENLRDVHGRVSTVLREHTGEAALTVETVAAIRNGGAEVLRARDIFLQMAEQGITESVLEEAFAAFDGRLRYGLDPAFDPRPIVGDDENDPRQQGYGNNDLKAATPDHGTLVAGLIGAIRGNGIGIDGVAPAVRLMGIRAVPDGDERDKDVANAIRYAVDNGAHIINMSFGKGYSPDKSVVDEAVRHAERRGVLLVNAAGNEGKDLEAKPAFPSRFFLDGDTASLWIDVGASSWRGGAELAASFSNYGRTRVHVFAPGVDMRSTAPDDGYRSESGTSFATPVVSGLAALLMAYYPDLDAADVKRIILESATRFADHRVVLPGSESTRVPFGSLSATGGVVNAYAAVLMAERIVAERARN